MAEITRNYHNDLQSVGLLHQENDLRAAAINETLDAIPNSQKLPNPEQSPLNAPLTRSDIDDTLRNVKLGTAAGPDEIPYELWKHLDRDFESDTKNEAPGFDVMKCMTKVINNIQTHSIDPSMQFTLGHMCPIFKKKERDNIQNYRPITLLNTDYKLMIKALATQLAKHAHTLIHPDQTGFIPKRTIFDPIRLAQTLCTYADYMEEDGVIVALDQEKAYNKIDHSYLEKVLQRFQLPDNFINTVKSLYGNAHTAAIVNGEISPTY